MLPVWDDRTLVEACIAGDGAAWAELRAIVARLAVGAARSYRLASHLIEDCTQATLEAVVKDNCAALRRIEGEGKLRGYLGTIVYRTARAYQREAGREAPLRYDATAVQADEDESVVADLLAHLSRADRLIAGWDLDGYPAPAIADLLSRLEGRPVTPAAIRKRLERIRKKLRIELDR
jgi:RNA polymerase sigma factor (sigma-70 family)